MLLRHRKGGLYKVLCIGKLESTLEDVVIYEAQYENDLSKIWVRPIKEFTEDRFTIVNNK